MILYPTLLINSPIIIIIYLKILEISLYTIIPPANNDSFIYSLKFLRSLICFPGFAAYHIQKSAQQKLRCLHSGHVPTPVISLSGRAEYHVCYGYFPSDNLLNTLCHFVLNIFSSFNFYILPI